MTSWPGEMPGILMSRKLGITRYSHIPKRAREESHFEDRIPTLESHLGIQLLAGEL